MTTVELKIKSQNPEFELTPSLNDLALLQALAYKRYQANPDQLIMPQLPTRPNLTIIFAEPNCLEFNPNNDPKTTYDTPETDQLRQLAQKYAGFFTVETTASPHQLPEAADLFDWGGWQSYQRTDYLGSFSPHPWLSPDSKLRVLQMLFCELNTLQQTHPPDQTLIVLADHVKRFVEQTGMIHLELLPATLKADSPKVQSLQTNFPTYWTKNPRLYQFNLLQ